MMHYDWMVGNANVYTALTFAAEKHSTQRRKDQFSTPYINHPIALVNILAVESHLFVDDIICGALLHDTIEDTDTTYEELVEVFGVHIADIVMELSDDKELDKHVRKQLQIDHAADASHEARIIKIADKIANLRDLAQGREPVGWSMDRILDYFDWAKDVMDNLGGTHSRLEILFDEAYELRHTLTESFTPYN